MGYNPKAIGERSEGAIMAAFLRAGEVVLKPFGDNQRYDLVLDRQGHFIRVQCKTGRIERGGILFATRSTNWNKGTVQNYKGQADLFAVYVPILDKVYTIPVNDVGDFGVTLRLETSRNGQSKKVRWAKDYEYHGSVA